MFVVCLFLVVYDCQTNIFNILCSLDISISVCRPLYCSSLVRRLLCQYCVHIDKY